MSGQAIAHILGVVCGLTAVASIAAYIIVVVRHRRWFNSIGLLLTGLGVLQLSLLLSKGGGLGTLINATFTVALFVAALAAQTYAAVRGRAAWDGVDRREKP
jgi:hypothetical protein